MLTRMETALVDKYDQVKKYLLHEFQMSSRVYLERFHSVVKQSDETYMLFASRLKGLFDFYVSSRNIDRDYDSLVSLIVADRMKQTLSEGCLNHVLSVEAGRGVNPSVSKVS